MLKALYQDVLRLLPESPSTSTQATVRCVARGLASPGFQALVVYRTFHWAHQRGIPTQPIRYLVERWVEVTTGISIPAEAELGPGLRIHHFGGIILHPGVRMGPGCTLYHDVTLGSDGLSDHAPQLGQEVLIGAGAKVLGNVQLGDRCRVGANAVVTRSFGPDSVVGGVPARELKERSS